MKKFISLALIAAMALSMALFMASCGGGEEEPAAEESAMKVTCVLSTNLGDMSFNDSAKAGMDALGENGFDVSIVECNNDANLFEQNLRSAADSADVVIAVGSELNMIGDVAKDYENVKFIWCDNTLENIADYPNLTCISYKQNEGSYLVGWIAGKMTESNVVGFIGGMDIPVINDFRVGFRQGAIDAGKDRGVDIKVVENFTGDWSDTNLGAECAQNQAGQGADIIFCAAGGSGNGAIMKAEELGIKCIGVDQDQRITMSEYADYILCSMIKNVGKSIQDVITNLAADESTWTGGQIFEAGMDGGYVAVAYGSDDQEKLVPDDLIAELDAQIEKLKAGELKVDTAL